MGAGQEEAINNENVKAMPPFNPQAFMGLFLFRI
jgi:hypothetical protein